MQSCSTKIIVGLNFKIKSSICTRDKISRKLSGSSHKSKRRTQFEKNMKAVQLDFTKILVKSKRPNNTGISALCQLMVGLKYTLKSKDLYFLTP